MFTKKPKPAFSRHDLKAWREGRKLTQAQAEEWWLGHKGSEGRTWRRWESGDSPIPNALIRTVETLGQTKRPAG